MSTEGLVIEHDFGDPAAVMPAGERGRLGAEHLASHGITSIEAAVAFLRIVQRWPQALIAADLQISSDEVNQLLIAGKGQLLEILGVEKTS